MRMVVDFLSRCFTNLADPALGAITGLIVALAIFAQGCSAQPAPVLADPFGPENASVIASGVRPDVVFIGDSITRSWHQFLPHFFDSHILERGVGKQTSAQILARFPDDVVALHPKIVQILAGTNDLFGTAGTVEVTDRVVKNVTMMVQQAKAAKITVIVAGVLPMTTITWRDEPLPADRVQTLDAQLRLMAEREGVAYVNYAAAVDNGAGGQQTSLTQDGVHPNAMGYRRIEPLARRAIMQALTVAR